MNLIDKVYNKNKAIWHRRFNMFGLSGIELHHPFWRCGIGKCCMETFKRAKHGHTDDWKWTKQVREEKRPAFEAAKKNYIRGLGCAEKIFKSCDYCAMPKLEVNQQGKWQQRPI